MQTWFIRPVVTVPYSSVRWVTIFLLRLFFLWGRWKQILICRFKGPAMKTQFMFLKYARLWICLLTDKRTVNGLANSNPTSKKAVVKLQRTPATYCLIPLHNYLASLCVDQSEDRSYIESDCQTVSMCNLESNYEYTGKEHEHLCCGCSREVDTVYELLSNVSKDDVMNVFHVAEQARR